MLGVVEQKTSLGTTKQKFTSQFRFDTVHIECRSAIVNARLKLQLLQVTHGAIAEQRSLDPVALFGRNHHSIAQSNPERVRSDRIMRLTCRQSVVAFDFAFQGLLQERFVGWHDGSERADFGCFLLSRTTTIR